MIPIIAGIISMLIQNQLPKLAQAVADKGVDYVQEKLGVELKPDMTPAEVAAMREAADKHEEFRINAATTVAVAEADNVSKRWASDMSSDSSFSKNIRPGTLVYILLVYTIFAFMSAYGVEVKEVYVRLLGEWGQIGMVAYFGSRGIEKVFDIINRPKSKP